MENDIDDNDDLFYLQGLDEGEEKYMSDLAQIGLAVIRDIEFTFWLTDTETVIDRILSITTNFYKKEIEHTEEGIKSWLESVKDGEVDPPRIAK